MVSGRLVRRAGGDEGFTADFLLDILRGVWFLPGFHVDGTRHAGYAAVV